MANEVDEQRIRARAYDLWQQDGSPEDRANEYPEKAQKEILAEGDGSMIIPAGQPTAHDLEGALSDEDDATTGDKDGVPGRR